MIEVNFHAEALAELDAAVEFYERRLEGLGIRFLFAVESQIERIAAYPDSGYNIEGDLRGVNVLGFPFTVIYRRAEDHVLLLAVGHQHRSPGYWAERS